MNRNIVFIATSLDGHIADPRGGIEWLTEIPSPGNGEDGGFAAVMNAVDALLMGRKTFDKVLSFGIPWPYDKKVFVWSSTLRRLPTELVGRVELVQGDLDDVLQAIHRQGFFKLYIDGGQTIQSFLRRGLVNELIVTLAPVLLGEGIRLFQDVPRTALHLKETKAFDNGMVQLRYELDHGS